MVKIDIHSSATNVENNTVSFSLKFLDFKQYGLNNLNKAQLKKLNNKLNQYTGMSIKEFLNTIKICPMDKQDTFKGERIIHYDIGSGFRIHGFLIGDRFKIVRIDPNHKYHN